MIKNMIVLLAVACCLTGCMSVDYEPVNENLDLPPTAPEAVKVYNNPAKVKKQYQTIGYCIASGNYRDFSKDAIMKRLREEAADVGADALVIKTYSVVPADSERLEQLTDMQNMNSDVFADGNGRGGSGWDRVSENFDSGYGSIRERRTVRTYSYRRVIRAKFITFGKTKIAAPKKQPAKPVKTIAVHPDKQSKPVKK
jgi:hypothetical protein